MTIFENNMDIQPGLPFKVRHEFEKVPDEAVPDIINLSFLTEKQFYSPWPAFMNGDVVVKYTVEFLALGEGVLLPGMRHTTLGRVMVDFDADFRVVGTVLEVRLSYPGEPMWLNSGDYNIILPNWMKYSAKRAVKTMRDIRSAENRAPRTGGAGR